MLTFIVRRALFLPVIWLAVTFAIFAMLAPLGPYQRLAMYVSVDPSSLSAKQGPEDMRRLIQQYGLDDPFMVQYQRWLAAVLHGDLGWSQTAQAPVAQALAQRLPATIELTLFAGVPMILLAIWLGTASAAHHGRWLDGLLRLVSVSTISTPVFVFGIVLQILLYGTMGWFAPGRLSGWAEEAVLGGGAYQRHTGLNTLDALLNGRADILADALQHLTLPVLVLTVTGWAGLMRITRSAMLEALGQEYVTTARAKGVSERRVVNWHARRNAMIPITTIGVGIFVGLLGGVALIEAVFNFPGVGLWAVQSARVFDVPAVIGLTLFTTTLVVVGNLLVDILYAVLDPRIRY